MMTETFISVQLIAIQHKCLEIATDCNVLFLQLILCQKGGSEATVRARTGAFEAPGLFSAPGMQMEDKQSFTNHAVHQDPLSEHRGARG